MKTITRTQFACFGAPLLLAPLIGCTPNEHAAQRDPLRVHAGSIVIESPVGTPRPPFEFDAQDSALLDEIESTTFEYFWSAVSPETGMVYDRTSSDVISVAGVGFQLAALPIGVERGWISRERAEARARLILTSLEREQSNRKAGLFYHFINPHDASARRVGRELVVSTVDSALLFSGMLVAGQYFGADIQTMSDRMFAQADWSFFLASPSAEAPDGAFLSLGWKPISDDDPTGAGELLPYFWLDCGDEHRLATLLGACAPNPEFRVPTQSYWALRRQLGYHEGQGHLVWFPYSGALFTSFFAHLFVDYNALRIDNPSAHGQAHRASVDWWENARRTVHLHRDRAIENPLGLPTLGADAWGFSASDGPDGYLVSGQFPESVEMIDAQAHRDFASYTPTDNWGAGVIAPYAPGSSIMFEPTLAIDALRYAKELQGHADAPAVWRDDWGFLDAYRVGTDGRTDWVAEDYVAISQGPLILGIENARSGLLWELFHTNPVVEAGIDRLGLQNPEN